MPTVLAFAKMNYDKDYITNDAPLAFDLSEESFGEKNYVELLEFKKTNKIKIDGKEYSEYTCKFSRIGSKTILYKGTEIKKYEIPVKFKAFREEESNIIFFNVRTQDANSFIKKINEITKTPIFEPIDMDLLEIAKKVHTVIGGWFRIPSADISSQSIHGSDILESKEFKKLSQLGNLSSMNIIYPYKGYNYKIVISGRGSIYLASKIEPKIQETIMILEIFRKLIL